MIIGLTMEMKWISSKYYYGWLYKIMIQNHDQSWGVEWEKKMMQENDSS
jgi:hypothetical protein